MAKAVNLFDPDGDPVETVAGNLQEKFGAPPFSVFDARQGWWQARKNAWIALGIQSEVGRGENLLRFSDTVLEPDAKKRSAANAVSSFRDQDKLGAIMRTKKSGRMKNGKPQAAAFGSGGPAGLATEFKTRTTVIPGGSTGVKNSAWKFKTAAGYISPKEQEGVDTAPSASGTSIFDPVLCELFYRWFVPKGGLIVDPFSGGSVRGIVASRLGYKYFGMDLREEQIVANAEQAALLCRKPNPRPDWEIGDSQMLDRHIKPGSADAIFSCPPYFNLEQYSDDPSDLSNMTYSEFTKCYDTIITKCAAALKPNRFVGWVIGEVRDEDGFCRGLVSDTIYLFERAGLRLYNDAILITAVGSLSIRVGRMFKAGRKLGRTHQHVLIFCKGSPQEATKAIGND